VWTLWAALLLGVAVLGWMAWRLARQMQAPTAAALVVLMHAFADALTARGWVVTRIPVTGERIDVLATAERVPREFSRRRMRRGDSINFGAGDTVIFNR
jgi:hypothetical protein